MLHVSTLPSVSVTVSVTSTSPTSAQVKAEGEISSEAIPQVSEDPLSISIAASRVASPLESSCSAKGAAQTAIGGSGVSKASVPSVLSSVSP